MGWEVVAVLAVGTGAVGLRLLHQAHVALNGSGPLADAKRLIREAETEVQKLRRDLPREGEDDISGA